MLFFSIFLEMRLHSDIIVIMTLPFFSPIDFSGHQLDINKFTYLLTYLALLIVKDTSTFHEICAMIQKFPNSQYFWFFNVN